MPHAEKPASLHEPTIPVDDASRVDAASPDELPPASPSLPQPEWYAAFAGRDVAQHIQNGIRRKAPLDIGGWTPNPSRSR